MLFYIVVNTIAELKPVFKDRRKHVVTNSCADVIQSFTNEKNIIS